MTPEQELALLQATAAGLDDALRDALNEALTRKGLTAERIERAKRLFERQYGHRAAMAQQAATHC